MSGVVAQRGIDVVVRLVDPTGKRVAVVNKAGTEGPEPWTLELAPSWSS